jgi:hypothetical protein
LKRSSSSDEEDDEEDDADAGEVPGYSEDYAVKMAATVAQAIRDQVPLRLGYLVNRRGESPCYAVFVWDKRSKRATQAKYMFTALGENESGSSVDSRNDIDRHVSLEVEVEDLAKARAQGRAPRLRTKRWRNGLWFSHEAPQEVLFPWPKSFQTKGWKDLVTR